MDTKTRKSVQPKIDPKLCFGGAQPAVSDRKLLARELHYAVLALGNKRVASAAPPAESRRYTNPVLDAATA